MTERYGRMALALAIGCGGFAFFVWATGGIDTRLAGIPLRSRAWERPAIVAALLAVVGAVAARRTLVAAAPRLVAIVPCMAALWILGASIAWGTFAAGGSDSYGYLSQARLFAQGRLTADVDADPAFDWPIVPATLMPLGFRVGTTPSVLAPVYPPGLPLLMAPVARGGAVFFVVPICAAAVVLLTWRLGRRLGAALEGALAALLLTVSSTFIVQAMQPMSDVPVTAFWMGALLLARSASAWGPAAAGVTASIAILIRPNLAPLALLVAAAAADGDRAAAFRRFVSTAAAAIPGVAALFAIQAVRYGTPLSSGYGSFGELFALANIAPNLARYPRWMNELHTPFVWLWLLAPIWIVRLHDDVRRPAWIVYAFALAVVVAYLPYVYFQPDEWLYTRFLLPALPLMLLLGLLGVRALLSLVLPSRVAAVATSAVAIVLTILCATIALRMGALDMREAERKYPDTGRFVREHLPRRAMVLAMQHSGSVRYYANRQTLRWDLLDSAWLDRAIATLHRVGREPYAVLDPDEDASFRARFAGQHAVDGMLEVGRVGSTRVYVFK